MATSSWISRSMALLAISLVNAQDLNFPFPLDATTPVPYTLSLDKAIVDEAVLKASLYRPSIDLLDGDTSNAGWLEGPPQQDMAALAKYWAENYDWARIQDEINSNFSHYAVNIQSSDGDVPIHFVHERSDVEDALPLLILHGWPSTHLEWSHVINPLASPEDPTAQAFHVVAPDLPGFGFSPAPTSSGLGPRRMGEAFHQLMVQLGYEKYGVVGTDIGYLVGLSMADQFPDNVVGYLSDFWIVQPNSTDLERNAQNQTTEEEALYIAAFTEWFGQHSSYSTVHQQAPLAIAQALTDSPVGFAGWMWHLMHAISDGYDYSFDELITDAMMLWIPGVYANVRVYKEMLKDTPELSFVTVPTAATQWGIPNTPFEPVRNFNNIPREWLQRSVNLVYLSRHETGGHFPAINEPELWVGDVREFFGSLVDGSLQ
ncbi:alpha/beta-hydrolase [Xylaria grammica]|nr:alpha/beta-hydrolase [Xylaria grammica]